MSDPFLNTQVVDSVEMLRALYGEPSARSLAKELDYLSDHYQAIVKASPFVLVASVAAEGLDISPRGDKAGFVAIHDKQTLMLPDRRGNNRADTLMNIVRDDRVSLIFMVPGMGETLRVNGRARVVIDDQLCGQFVVQGKAPRSVVVVRVERAYFQCQKALARSGLWDPANYVDRSQLPTAGQMIADQDSTFDAAGYDASYPEHMARTIY